MTLKDVVTQFLETLVKEEVQKVLPFIASLIPGVPGQLLSEVLSRPEVQQKIADLETKGVLFVVEEMAKGLDDLRALVASHVHGRLADAVKAALHASPPEVHLTADQVRQLAVLAAAGKLDAALQSALGMFGLLPAAGDLATAKTA